MRAFGLFLADMVGRVDAVSQGSAAYGRLVNIREQCIQWDTAARPTFADIAAACKLTKVFERLTEDGDVAPGDDQEAISHHPEWLDAGILVTATAT